MRTCQEVNPDTEHLCLVTLARDHDHIQMRLLSDTAFSSSLQSFFVYKRGFVFGARDEVMLNVDSDKLTIIPYNTSGGALRREAKLVSYLMENVMEVQYTEEKAVHKDFGTAAHFWPI